MHESARIYMDAIAASSSMNLLCYAGFALHLQVRTMDLLWVRAGCGSMVETEADIVINGTNTQMMVVWYCNGRKGQKGMASVCV